MRPTCWRLPFGLKDGAAGYRALLSTLLPVATVDCALASGATGIAQIGGAYMQALADKFRMAIEKDALGKGAMRVAVLNMPGIDKTPRVGSSWPAWPLRPVPPANNRCVRSRKAGCRPSMHSLPRVSRATPRWWWWTSTPRSTTRWPIPCSSASPTPRTPCVPSPGSAATACLPTRSPPARLPRCRPFPARWRHGWRGLVENLRLLGQLPPHALRSPAAGPTRLAHAGPGGWL
jgi:hypothetical protein